MENGTGTVLSLFGVKPLRVGGCETFARELSAQLGARNWRSVLCFAAEPAGATRSFLTLPNVALEVIPDLGVSGGAQFQGICQLIRKHRPRILHLHFTGFLSPYPWLAKLLGVEKIYFTDQGSHPEGFVPSRAAWWKRLATRLINAPLDRVLCCSGYNVRCFHALGALPPERFLCSYNSVDFRRVGADGTGFRQKFGLSSSDPLVVQTSWIIPEKGIEDLLRAARLVVDRIPAARFAFVGKGHAQERFTGLGEELGLGDRIIWAGLAEDPIGEGVFAAADVVCQVSRWEEAFGWVIAEAMACSRPVVGTRVGGIPEVIADGETGFVVEKGDVPAMAGRLIQLLEDPALRLRFGEEGYRRAKALFDLERQVEQVISLYEAR